MPAASLAMHPTQGGSLCVLCIEAIIGHTVMVTLDDPARLAQPCLDFIEQLGEGELVNDTRC